MTAIRRSMPAALLALLAAACGSGPAVHGTVTGKTYIPADTTMQLQPYYGSRCTVEIVVVQVGSTSEDEDEDVCSQYVIGMRLVPVTTPECWQVTVTGPSGGTVCASKSDYDGATVGGTW